MKATEMYMSEARKARARARTCHSHEVRRELLLLAERWEELAQRRVDNREIKQPLKQRRD